MGFQSRGALVGLAALGAAAASCGSGAHGTAPSSGSVIVDSAELRWAREGSGPVVFVLGSSVYYPKAFSASLRGHFEMVFVDGRHFVPTYVPDSATLAEISLETFADDVEVVRAALGYARIAVLGHSIHGQIALRYAEKYPAFTSRVILVAPVPYSYDEFRAAILARALEGGRHLTRAELAAALKRSRISTKGQPLPYLMMYAELEQVICSGAPRGKQHTYALFDDRVPASSAVSADEALAALAMRFFRSRGAATVQDFSLWSGLTLTQAGHGLAMAGTKLDPLTIGPRTYWIAEQSFAT